MSLKKAFITGVTGQDGSYLAEFLLNKGYEVHAILRRTSIFTTQRIDHMVDHKMFFTYYGDMTDSSNLHTLLSKIKPDEIYNLAAQSHVAVSFEVPEYTAEVDSIGVVTLLDIIKNLDKKPKLYQATTSELFDGSPITAPQNEKTSFAPKSPYGAAKLYAYWMTEIYRKAYKLFICNGIAFNHESPRRGLTFVTKKISKAVADIYHKKQNKIELGNLDSRRDWGYSKDYIECMWLMLQYNIPDNYVIATGETHTIRDFVELAFKVINIDIEWVGSGINEKGIDKKNKNILVEINPKYFRPLEVECLCGDYSKVKNTLGWEPKVKFKELVEIMVKYDLKYDNYGGKEE